MTHTNSVTFTVTNPTKEQLAIILKALKGAKGVTKTDTTDESESEEVEAAPKKGKKGKPESTVSDDEDEEFGTKGAVDEEDFEESDSEDEEESEESEGADSEEDEDEEQAAVSWEDVTDALNTYGEKHPDEAKALLLGFKVKSTKDLKTKKGLWESVYRKVKAKLKALKKKK